MVIMASRKGNLMEKSMDSMMPMGFSVPLD